MELADHFVVFALFGDHVVHEVGNLLYQFGEVHGRAPRVIADVGQDVLQKVSTVGEGGVREGSAGSDYRGLEREFVL